MDLMRSRVDIEEARGEMSAYWMMMNMKVLLKFCGSVQSRVFYEMTLYESCKSFLQIDLNVLKKIFCHA